MTGGKKKLEQERQTWAKEVDSLKSERESLKEERAKQAAEIVRLQEQHTKAGEVERLKEEERGRQEAEIARLTQELSKAGTEHLARQGPRPPPASLRWKPCEDTGDRFANLAEPIRVFQDSENIWFPNHPDLVFHNIKNALVDLAVSLADACSGEGGGGGVERKRVSSNFDWSYFYPSIKHDPHNPLHPSNAFFEDMVTANCSLLACGSKKGAVDTSMKAAINKLVTARPRGGTTQPQTLNPKP